MNIRLSCFATSLVFFCAGPVLAAPDGKEPAGYSNADLPDAMTSLNGQEVQTADDWSARKAEIKKLWCDHLIGHFPEETPALLSAEVVKTVRPADGSVRERVMLTFDTRNKKSFEIEVWRPAAAASGARPLLLTQPRNYQREKWGEAALKRGYVVCIYPGLDAHHTEKDYPGYQNVWKTFKAEYPNATWSSSLGIQAWLASRTLDFLLDPSHGQQIDPTAVGITGFSRFGVERTYLNAKKAWRFLGMQGNICLSYRKGNHSPVTDEQVKHNLDYFDTAFDRGNANESQFPEVLLHAFD